MTLGLYKDLWLKLFLQGLSYQSRRPVRPYFDDKATCDIVHNLAQHDCTKHVEVDIFFVKEKLY